MKCSCSIHCFFYYKLECPCPCLHFILTSNYDLGNNQDVLFPDLQAMWDENAQLVLKEFFPSCYTVLDDHISKLCQCKMNLSAQCNTDSTLPCPISLWGQTVESTRQLGFPPKSKSTIGVSSCKRSCGEPIRTKQKKTSRSHKKQIYGQEAQIVSQQKDPHSNAYTSIPDNSDNHSHTRTRTCSFCNAPGHNICNCTSFHNYGVEITADKHPSRKPGNYHLFHMCNNLPAEFQEFFQMMQLPPGDDLCPLSSQQFKNIVFCEQDEIQ